MDRANISQCMIVKNEEENIIKALSWGKKIMAEQIVIDTGSTDRTIELAKQMGAIVYEFPWDDDFAAAKNYAIEKARYDWIAFLDADEYMDSQQGEKLIEFVQQLHNTKTDMIITAFVNLNDEGNVLSIDSHSRIFRSYLRYEGKIHESLTLPDGSMLQAADLTKELTIFHTGYGNQERKKKKGRNERLLLLELEKNPDDYKLWGYLGVEYLKREGWKEAEKSFRKAVVLMPEKEKGVYNVTSSIVLLKLLSTVMKTSDELAVQEVYKQAIQGWPEEADYDYKMAEYFADSQNWTNSIKHLERALKLLGTYGNTCKSGIISGNIQKAYEMLAICYYNNGNIADSVRLTAVLLKANPYLMSTLLVLLRSFLADPQTVSMRQEGAQQIAEYLGNTFYDFCKMKDKLFVLRAAIAAGWEDLVLIIRKLFTCEELVVVDNALRKE